MSLVVDDFVAFHRAVHGYAPFEWQLRLLKQIDADHRWPRVLDLPTGAGKTTCIDIALFALAIDATRPVEQRWCPRRIAMVVDRRVVVDQVAERGRKLLAAISEPTDPAVRAAREALRTLAGDDEEPLAVFTLRGGIPKDDGWARTPHQPLVIASTVDQLGSRLLVQGYGVSQSMRPVHAGLLGNDTLLLLDEVHLSRPFADTLDSLATLRGAVREGTAAKLPRRFAHVFLSATPGSQGGEVFRLEPRETSPGAPLGPRLHAAKPTKLETVEARAALPERCATLASALVEEHQLVAVVLNRVASARATARQLKERLAGRVEVLLLTGRMRPLDRDDVLARWRPYIAAGRERVPQAQKLIVVGTQCIEAGADFDFDAMVSESASLDALRQRMGRVDRLGRYGRAQAVIVHVRDTGKDDPIYGAALGKTWKWLESRKKNLDFGIQSLKLPDDTEELLAPRKHAPTLMPAYMDLWMQSAPPPAVAPEVALFLHGPSCGPPDVQVVWRADLPQIAAKDVSDEASSAAGAIVSSLRPTSLEAVSVPYHATLAWLRGQDEPYDAADVDGTSANDEADRHDRHGASAGRFAVLRWLGAESRWISADELRPGDSIIVPCSVGGLHEASFDPSDPTPVNDIAERAALLARGRAVVRLHPAVLEGLGWPPIEDAVEVRVFAREALEVEVRPWRRTWLERLCGRHRRTVVSDTTRGLSWLVVESDRLTAAALRHRLGTAAEPSAEAGVDLTSDEEDSYHVGRGGVTLACHSVDVETFARQYAAAVGLPDPIVEDIALAGWLHDIGKADSRFQLLLRGGDEIELFKDERLWAKSMMSASDRAAQWRARQASGYPAGARHEVLSVAMIERAREAVAAKANDLELVLHLVASHHGHCRPFAPAIVDAEPVNVELADHASPNFGHIDFAAVSSDHELHRLDAPLADRFWTLVERYGWLELCWLEAILRLADHRASELEEDLSDPEERR